MNLHTDAARIDGYLLAVASLKDDGTAFRCVHLGEGEPSGKARDVADKFGLDAQSIELIPNRATATAENLPVSLEDWLLKRIHLVDAAPDIDRKLASGLAAELFDIFSNRAPAWFEVVRTGAIAPSLHMGAFWAIYVFGLDVGSCAIHCSWDD